MKYVSPYLTFNGNCRQAMKFYNQCLGGELHLMTFSEVPGQSPAPEIKDKIMHARLQRGSLLLMASDSMPDHKVSSGTNINLSLECESIPEIEKVFNALGENGKITMPLQDTFWGARFGMLTDQFGMHWMLNCELKK